MATCDFCGESFKDGRRACPHCGSDADTGWNEDADDLGLELPETALDDGDYDDFLRREGLAADGAADRNSRGFIVLLIVLGLLLPSILVVLWLIG
ncbi:MAG: hypothetical protein CMJ83_12110 [Planctomycetes bacterium]|nr:hypothetical protein [Planctomycetota bacterium]